MLVRLSSEGSVHRKRTSRSWVLTFRRRTGHASLYGIAERTHYHRHIINAVAIVHTSSVLPSEILARPQIY